MKKDSLKNNVPLNIVVLGHCFVGKSALTIQYIHQYFLENYDPTIEDKFMQTIHIDDRDVRLVIYDTAGQDEYLSVIEHLIRIGHGFLIVMSIDDINSAKEVYRYHNFICRIKETQKVPMLLIANKHDLHSTDQERVTIETIKALSQNINVGLMETSAKTRYNVDNVFVQITRLILNDLRDKQQIGKQTVKCSQCLVS
ncbi:hypothetical protein SNEBB_011234 [Seison nebaliae]|nr:hypothetical protein SNEBB_011234 [Seison nebaliae]